MSYERSLKAILSSIEYFQKDGVVHGKNVDELAKKAGVSKNTFLRGIVALSEQRRLKVIKSRGRGLCNIYQLTTNRRNADG